MQPIKAYLKMLFVHFFNLVKKKKNEDTLLCSGDYAVVYVLRTVKYVPYFVFPMVEIDVNLKFGITCSPG